MPVLSIQFLLALVVLAILGAAPPLARFRPFMLQVGSLLFIGTYLQSFASWIILGVFLSSGYFAARWLQRKPSGLVCAAYITALVLAFIWLKDYSVLRAVGVERDLSPAVALVGLSYMFFRQVHVVVDAWQGQLPPLSPASYLLYQTSLYTLLAGPIQRYPDFLETQRTPLAAGLRAEQVAQWQRLFTGIIKLAIGSWGIAAGLEWRQTLLTDTPESPWATLWLFALVLYLFPVSAYLDFSGYCDVVIAGARLYGLRVPENFDRPWLARNMIDFWNRWHITLSHWVRDYIFMAGVKAWATRWPGSLAVAAYGWLFLAFLVVGLWHGTTSNFAVFAVLQGVGVCAAKLAENLITWRYSRRGLRAYLENRWVRIVAIVATLHYVAFSLFFINTGSTPGLAPCLTLLKISRDAAVAIFTRS